MGFAPEFLKRRLEVAIRFEYQRYSCDYPWYGRDDKMRERNEGYEIMSQLRKGIAHGTVHSVPADWRKALMGAPAPRALWQDITPLARNEWICWILDAKKPETRQRRIEVGLSKLESGMRRPCCWAGCKHRSK